MATRNWMLWYQLAFVWAFIIFLAHETDELKKRVAVLEQHAAQAEHRNGD